MAGSNNRLPQADLDLFIDNAAAATLLRVPRRSRLLLWVIVLFMISALAWASWAELDEVTVGEGRIIPSQQLQVVQNLEGGIVKEVFVAEGDLVKKGQPLLRIDDTRFNSDFRERRQQLDFLRSKIVRLKTALSSILIKEESIDFAGLQESIQVVPLPLPPFEMDDKGESNTRKQVLQALRKREQAQLDEQLRNLDNQLSIIDRQVEQREQERVELLSRIKHLKTNYNLALKEYKLTRPLAEQGVVPKVELIKLEREVNGIKQELDSSRLLLPKVSSEIKEQISKRRDVALQYRNETQTELAEAESQLAQASEGQVGLRDRVERTTVVSPVTGVVKQVSVNTVGGVVQPGMDLMEIVPAEDNLLVEAKILPKDIAFLRPGLNTVVRFSAYDFSIYGGLNGRLEHISADSIEDDKGNTYYLIRVRTDKNYLGKGDESLPIIPGMLASVDILTGKKTVLDYLLKPILKAQQSALRER